jgi:hypothetical protein
MGPVPERALPDTVEAPRRPSDAQIADPCKPQLPRRTGRSWGRSVRRQSVVREGVSRKSCARKRSGGPVTDARPLGLPVSDPNEGAGGTRTPCTRLLARLETNPRRIVGTRARAAEGHAWSLRMSGSPSARGQRRAAARYECFIAPCVETVSPVALDNRACHPQVTIWTRKVRTPGPARCARPGRA